MKLLNVHTGERCRILSISDGRLGARLESVGAEKGDIIAAVRGGEYRGGMVIEAAGTLIALRRDAAALVEVELV